MLKCRHRLGILFRVIKTHYITGMFSEYSRFFDSSEGKIPFTKRSCPVIAERMLRKFYSESTELLHNFGEQLRQKISSVSLCHFRLTA